LKLDNFFFEEVRRSFFKFEFRKINFVF